MAAAIRRKATRLGLDDTERNNADVCAVYLLAKADYLDYPTALEKGWPITTRVIEGACRHIVSDRLDITGARWGHEGTEAVLKPRALRANDDWEGYWTSIGCRSVSECTSLATSAVPSPERPEGPSRGAAPM